MEVICLSKIKENESNNFVGSKLQMHYNQQLQESFLLLLDIQASDNSDVEFLD
jgi:hypothetical protein